MKKYIIKYVRVYIFECYIFEPFGSLYDYIQKVYEGGGGVVGLF